MISKIKPVLILVTLFLVLFFSVSPSFAQEEKVIKVSGFSPTRSGSPLLNALGNPYVSPAGPSTGSNIIASFISSPERFGPGKTIECSVDFQAPTDYISSGSLVNVDGKLLVDVFFATNTTQPLTQEEITELKKFLLTGGVVYAHTTASGGDQYVPLFQELSIDISFGERQQESTPTPSSDPEDIYLTTNGPFGTVGPLIHGPFRSILASGVSVIAYSPNLGTNILVESQIGSGYLAVASSPLHVNVLAQGNNIRYFSNLVAIGCKDDNSIVLPVPSFKQGLEPYDGIDPVWEKQIYDDALNTLPNCGQTMADCACALTSATMVMRYFDVNLAPDASSINPEIINNFFKVNSVGFIGPNFRWSYAGNFSAEANSSLIGGGQTKLEQPVRLDYDLEDIKALIQGEKPVILKVNDGSHWVVVKGYDPDDDRLIINDPLYPDPPPGQHAYLDERYTPDTTGSMVVYETTNSDYRYLEFAAVSKNHLLVEDVNGNKTGYDAETGQIVKQIPNSDYALDEYYGPPTDEGVYFLTIKLPSDGEFSLEIISQDGQPHPVQVYSSDIEGKLAGKTINPEVSGENYTFVYNEETAGEFVSAFIDAAIDINPLMKNNLLVPPNKKFPVPVAVLGSEAFDVAKVNQNSLTFGENGYEQSFDSCDDPWDINRDGEPDLVCNFIADELGLGVGDTEATLKGMYEGGIYFSATDLVWLLKPWFLF
ncbi:hypothetical protein A2803_02870 [Candidatus Woesebacteria bacterium RIFCSPHIGHO2_01_FULL_44_21]|uniref:Peptidase C39-like domain-containing protein n=1 Tax=Candidatus Woesebacteria bacterium RIFCSPHIGHO2_01_FULL_44_21 TaxID=1802503 RepID=A0A1F7YZ62_9BACT|nr:MAG: hypothetical protein A2803_02870 [Candidatus Woesebacteria bacterium RIFCSPHIGHO2_01_FULL_44_21]OGM71314.1 MAG: hypothetical protein A2897_00770 [Candidatus Woesebacteria bacterium RIFCSPLOWO2_01_FULL_44_24b]